MKNRTRRRRNSSLRASLPRMRLRGYHLRCLFRLIRLYTRLTTSAATAPNMTIPSRISSSMMNGHTTIIFHATLSSQKKLMIHRYSLSCISCSIPVFSLKRVLVWKMSARVCRIVEPGKSATAMSSMRTLEIW